MARSANRVALVILLPLAIGCGALQQEKSGANSASSDPTHAAGGVLTLALSGIDSITNAKAIDLAITAVDGSTADNRAIRQALATSTNITVSNLIPKSYKVVLQLLDESNKVIASGQADSVAVKANAEVPVKISLTNNKETGSIKIEISVSEIQALPVVSGECEKLWANGVTDLKRGLIFRKLADGKNCTDLGAEWKDAFWMNALEAAPAQCPLPTKFESYTGGWETWNQDLWRVFRQQCANRQGNLKEPQWGQDTSPSRGAGCTLITWRFCAADDPVGIVYRKTPACERDARNLECPVIMPKVPNEKLCSSMGINENAVCGADKLGNSCVLIDYQCVNGFLADPVYLQCRGISSHVNCPSYGR